MSTSSTSPAPSTSSTSTTPSTTPAAIPAAPPPVWPQPPASAAATPPVDPYATPPTNVPPGQYVVQLLKSFTTNGTTYAVGDYYTGYQADISALIRQGFCLPPK